jgi:hypothetical protein
MKHRSLWPGVVLAAMLVAPVVPSRAAEPAAPATAALISQAELLSHIDKKDLDVTCPAPAMSRTTSWPRSCRNSAN